MSNVRQIHQIIPAQPTSDGDGVKIRRVAGFNHQQFSPFLMLDELKSDERADYVGGFPPHPHRGIETLTYMMQGHFQHRDHMGNVGELRSGGAQWMAAGRGVIHSEMPMMEDGSLHGFQIWINQPAKNKMQPAQYHDFQPEVITEYTHDETGLLRVLAGQAEVAGQMLSGPLLQTGVPLLVADWRANLGKTLHLKIPQQHQAMIYVYRGEVQLDSRVIKAGELALLTQGDSLMAQSNTPDNGMLILAGEPIHEPVVHYGPFVMNSYAEIEQAINDYNSGQFETY
ncbi:pirin family protein [Vibrio spartinae]|uniref:Quercetin 2,3-dioxygenase n=1 Tax=Vibrio spartinae TaxID=1918945 RepID=A0A1N6MBR9_9VIBR|nr:pirin family protein [Vibrio spartinae]QMV16985.1 Quercetin 2,3-dioxygenase [Vibrio spartinae]SIO96810.1 Quercetin 2,3-dioxygenase [Vibrio spartinae]